MTEVDAYYENLGFKLAAAGPIVATGGDDTYIVAEPGFAIWEGNPGLNGFSITTLTRDDGTWLSRQVRWIGEDLP